MALNELVLPQKIQLDEKTASDRYGKFTAEPYESGYGHTVGNSLRRILLSGMEGAAVTTPGLEACNCKYSRVFPSIFTRKCLKFSKMLMTSSRTLGTALNSCTAPVIRTALTAAPSIPESKIRRKEFPTVCP